MQYKYRISPLAIHKVRVFYWHMLMKYSNTYSYSDMLRYINNTVDSMYKIEDSLLRRRPIIQRWQGYYMAHAGNWYYAYTIDGDRITIRDACHQQNMH